MLTHYNVLHQRHINTLPWHVVRVSPPVASHLKSGDVFEKVQRNGYVDLFTKKHSCSI